MKGFLRIWGIVLTIMLVLAMLVLPAPVAAGEMDVGPTFTADLAVISAPAVHFALFIPAPAPVAAGTVEASLMVALSVLLLTIAVAYIFRRRLLYDLNELVSGKSGDSRKGTKGGGGTETKYIIPVSAADARNATRLFYRMLVSALQP